MRVLPSSGQVIAGKTLKLTAWAEDAAGSILPDFPIAWETSDPGTAAVDSRGMVTGIEAGPATITVRSGDKFSAVSISVVSGWVPLGGPINASVDSSLKVFAWNPSLSFSATTPYVAWAEGGTSINPQGGGLIRLAHWTGSSWKAEGSFPNRGIFSAFTPSLAFSSTTAYVAWAEESGWIPTTSVTSTTFTASGTTTTITTTITTTTYFSSVFLSHYDGSQWIGHNGAVNFSSSSYGFCPKASLVPTPTIAWLESSPIVTIFTTATRIITDSSGAKTLTESAFSFIPPNDSLLFAAQWVNGSWERLGGALNTLPKSYALCPSMTYFDGKIVVGWSEAAGIGSYKAYVASWNGTGWQPLGPPLNIKDDRDALSPSVVRGLASDLYAAWIEKKRGKYPPHLFMKRWDGREWSPLGGSLNIEDWGSASNPLVSVHNGQPYVSWVEIGRSGVYKIHVKSWDGKRWNQVGGSVNRRMDMNAFFPSLDIIEGLPFVSWSEIDHSTGALHAFCSYFPYP